MVRERACMSTNSNKQIKLVNKEGFICEKMRLFAECLLRWLRFYLFVFNVVFYYRNSTQYTQQNTHNNDECNAKKIVDN